MNSPPDLHDATLKKLTFNWANATLLIEFQTGVGASESAFLEAHAVTEMRCPRTQPWGPSNSVNTVKVTPLSQGQILAIEMQSGDIIEVNCQRVAMKGNKDADLPNR